MDNGPGLGEMCVSRAFFSFLRADSAGCPGFEVLVLMGPE